MLLAGACTRPGSETAPQRFGSQLSGPGVQVLDRRLVLTLPPGEVAPTTISSYVAELGVKVSVVPGELDTLTEVGQADVALIDDVTLAQLIAAKLVEPIDRSLVANRKLLLPPFDSPSYDKGGAPQRAQGLRRLPVSPSRRSPGRRPAGDLAAVLRPRLHPARPRRRAARPRRRDRRRPHRSGPRLELVVELRHRRRRSTPAPAATGSLVIAGSMAAHAAGRRRSSPRSVTGRGLPRAAPRRAASSSPPRARSPASALLLHPARTHPTRSRPTRG